MTGVYCAVSFDDGDTWKKKPMTADVTVAGRNQTGFDGRNFTMAYDKGEPKGYMAAAVYDESVITLITSRNSYSCNLAWLSQPARAPPGV